MANFAKEQLLKYGWTEGRGLGKNENGITEPIKLVTNKNNAGLGYDDDEPWWEKMFNDASKNIKVESHDNEVSLSVVNDTNALCSRNKVLNSAESLENMFAYQKFTEAGKDMIKENCARTSDQKLRALCSKMVHETRHNLTSGGKLERIAEQDKIFLNANNKFQLNASPVEENAMVFRKMKIESDMEENEHKVDNEDILQSEEKDTFAVLSKSTRKKHRKRLNNLMRQLDTFTLEENNEKPVCQNNKKLCQKMKKNKDGKKIDSSILMNYLMNGVNDKIYQMSTPCDTNHHKLNKNNTTIDQMNYKLQMILDLSRKRRTLREAHAYASSLGRCGKHCETDNIGYMIEPHTELRNGIEINETKTVKKRYEDWIIFHFQDKTKTTKQLDKNYDYYKEFDYYTKKMKAKQGISKRKKNVQHIDKKGIGYQSCAIRLDNKIQKKKNARYHHLKQIEKAVEKIKGEALAHEALAHEALAHEALAHELNCVIKNMTTFGISEEVNANTIKNKCTQTHRTPV